MASPKIVSQHRLPVNFLFFEHPTSKLLFAEFSPYLTNGRHWVVPRQPPSKGLKNTLDDQAKACVLDAEYWLKLTAKTRIKTYQPATRLKLAPVESAGKGDPVFWMLDI